MKFVVIATFLTFCIHSSWSQSSSNYINKEVDKIDNFLKKGDPNRRLSNEQRVTISKILEPKESALMAVYEKKMSKTESSKAVSIIENQYFSRIENVLSTEQRVILAQVRQTSVAKQ
jgi:hypothetical protein